VPDKHFFAAVEAALREDDIGRKCAALAALSVTDCDTPEVPCSYKLRTVLGGLDKPGRPALPVLVSPRDLPRRSLGSIKGRATLVHAIAHIEFNAINLALDALWRFRDLPAAYYQDWLSVAIDEARHFVWLNRRLQELGQCYGDFPAHNGLWEAACNTAHDPLLRMALVPRVLEARGLDVTPAMIERLRSNRDDVTADILVKILDEEVRHVTIGTRWYHFLCVERGLEPDAHFEKILNEHMRPLPKAVLNMAARRASGFSEVELEYLRRAG
jgi:uncharacterized ferritin-like protein (DUF455 family)